MIRGMCAYLLLFLYECISCRHVNEQYLLLLYLMYSDLLIFIYILIYLLSCYRVDFPRFLGLPLLQPNKVHIRDRHDALWPHAMRLLEAMETAFYDLHLEMSGLYLESQLYTYERHECGYTRDSNRSGNSDSGSEGAVCDEVFLINNAAIALLKEFHDCYQILYLRIAHVHALYQSASTTNHPTTTSTSSSSTTISSTTTPYASYTDKNMTKAMYQKKSRGYIQQASVIVLEREAAYRVPWERVAAWRDNPTVYRLAYLCI